MHLLIFTEGTIIMHRSAKGLTRKEIVAQVKSQERSVKDYSTYIPIGNSPEKLKEWDSQGMTISYITSRRKPEGIEQIREVLKSNNFPEGELYFRENHETYSDVIERVMPEILIEDDCESIGGEQEMCITNVNPEKKKLIKAITVKEFGGIDAISTTP